MLIPKGSPNDPNTLRSLISQIEKIKEITEKKVVFENGELVLMVTAGTREIIEKIKNIEEVREVRIEEIVWEKGHYWGYHRKRRRGTDWFPE